MKFFAVLVLIGVICAVKAATKEELEQRAKELEVRLEREIRALRASHPLVARVLEVQDAELKIISRELEAAHLPALVARIEVRLSIIERVVEDELRRLERSTGTPTSRPTGTPSEKPTGSPSPRPTGSPSPRPTGTPARTTGTPARPTGTPARTTGTPVRPTGTPARTTGTPARPTGTPARTTGTPARPTGTPARTTGTPARPTGTPARPTGSPSPRPTTRAPASTKA